MDSGTIYTAVTAGYDRSPLSEHDEPFVTLEVRKPPEGVDPVLWNREHKLVQPPRVGVWSLYLDGSLSPKGQVRDTIETWLDRHDMALFKHPWRTCAYDEIDECARKGKITAAQAEKVRSHFLLAGFPRHFGLWALGMIARRTHCNALQIFVMPMVWHHVQDVPRDQIWFPFVLWRLKESTKRINTIDADIFNNKFLSFRRHGK